MDNRLNNFKKDIVYPLYVLVQIVSHTRWVTSICFSPNCNFIASGSEDKLIIIWDIDKGN